MTAVSPVQLVRFDDPPSRVPLVVEPFWIGRDPHCDLCVWDLRVSRRHAKIKRVRGEYLLSSEGVHPTFVNGKRATLFGLRSGDEIALTDPTVGPAVRIRFENGLQNVFVPPGASLTAMWHERHPDPAGPNAIGRYDLGAPLDDVGISAVRGAIDRNTGKPVAVKILGPVSPGPEGDRFLRLAAALSGATHPSLARVVEAGISVVEERPVRWLAMALVQGRPSSARIAEGPQSAVTVLRRIRGLAGALDLLHARGVVHGDVVPENILLRPDGSAALLDFARAFLVRDGVPASVPVVSEPAYVAPEASRIGATALSFASDVYGLAAAGYAMLAGKAPERGGEWSGPALPQALQEVWARALAEDPGRRPTAEAFALAIAGEETPAASGARP
jgi:hypothetical protein